MSNLPVDVTPGDIDRAFGGADEFDTVHGTVTVAFGDVDVSPQATDDEVEEALMAGFKRVLPEEMDIVAASVEDRY